jgi:hypothetical protein
VSVVDMVRTCVLAIGDWRLYGLDMFLHTYWQHPTGGFYVCQIGGMRGRVVESFIFEPECSVIVIW